MATPRGRGRTAWKKDPEILERLTKVHRFYLERWPVPRMAEELGVTERTVRYDIDRMREMYFERHGADMDREKDEHIAVYRHVQEAAWQEFQAVKDTSLNKSAFLNTIKSCEDSIADILGTKAPAKVAQTDANGNTLRDRNPIKSPTTIAIERAIIAVLSGEPLSLGAAQGDDCSPDSRSDSVRALPLSSEVPN